MRMKLIMLASATIAALCLASPAVTYAGQVKGEQGTYPALKKDFSFRDFSNIRVKPSYSSISGRGTFIFGYFRITVVKSDTYKVEMNVRNREDIDLFDIRKSGNTLELLYGYRKYPYHSSPKKDIEADVIIHTPELSEITLSGISSMTISGEGFSGKNLTVNMSAASKLNGLSGKWDSAFMDISGCSEAENISVDSGTLKLNASGAAKISGKSGFSATDSRIDLSGAASLKFTAFHVGNLETDISGAAGFISDRMDARTLKLSISGGASFKTSGDLTAVSATLSGAATATLSGTGDKLSISGNGSASLKARDFTVKSAEISASGASASTLTVTERLETDVKGFASVDYYGNPKEVRSRTDNVRGH